jgi:lipid-binding SYLF domain-containing protein
MMLGTRLGAGLVLVLAVLVGTPLSATPVLAASAAEINRDVDAALTRLVEAAPSSRALAQKAKAVLVFPKIVKAGFMFGAQYGEGVLRRGNKNVGYYNTLAASYGWQAGAQAFGYALFFMNESSLSYLDKSEGFEVGIGPSVVVLDEGMGKSMTSSTVTQDIYAIIFDQKGLMAGAGVQGSKISKIDK